MLCCPSRRRVSFLLKLLTLLLVAMAVVLSNGLTKNPPATAPQKPPVVGLRAFGAVHPRLSPSGKDVVFSYHGSIWRMPIKGGTMKRLASGPGFAFEPCWSPDGRRVAFFQGKAWDSGRVRVIDAQTGASIPLASEVFATGKLFFTPNGNHLIGKLRSLRQLEALRSLNLKTGALKTVLRFRAMRQPWALSDDGKWIAYVTSMDQPEQQGGNDGPQADLWKVPASGGEAKRMVRFPARIHDVCWSADGKSLFVSSELGGVHNDLWRIDLNDPDQPVKLTFGQADEDRPSVSRDGRWLLYTDNKEGCPALVLRDLAAGTTQPLTVDKLDFGTPTGRLRLHVQDKGTGKPLVARVALEHTSGSEYAPPGALWRIFRDFGHFYVRDRVEFDLPAGSYRLRAWHGPEYRVQVVQLVVKAGETREQKVALTRWTDAKGWYSGDNHIHANYGYGEYYNSPATMADMCAGEDLNVCNFMVANSDGDGVFDREYFRGRPDPHSTPDTILYWNEEFRSTIWGHLTLVNLKQVVEPVFTGFKDTTNPYDIPSMSNIAWKTHRQGGLVNYTHPASLMSDLYRGAYSAKGLPIYAALGKIDTMDVMGSADRPSTALYHRLLNCGFRLAASAGTDCFLNRMRSWLPGGERVYVQVKAPFTYARWIAGLRAGRSFVTNGPMLELSVNGKGLGDVLKLQAAAEVKVRATASSQWALDRVDVLYNGQVVASAKPSRQGPSTQLDKTVRIDRSGWLALRAAGPAAPEVKGELVYAHTSPVYVVVAGKPAGSAEDARYFLRWIDRLWDTVEQRDRFPDQRSQAEVEAEVDAARKVFQKMAAPKRGQDS
jgi:TolB protein